MDGTIRRHLADESETARLAEDIAAAARPGDVIALAGDLGAGKTSFARAFIRAVSGDNAVEVPSPTYTIVQTYEARIPIRHFDLYRLSGGDEFEEIGLGDGIGGSITLVEWPDRAGADLPPHLRLDLVEAGDGGRGATLAGPDDFMARVSRALSARDFLDGAGCRDARRRFLMGDASSRAYETISRPGEARRILMNAPRRPDGPPIRDGKPYSRIAHLAESVHPFVAVGTALRESGIQAPEIFASDLDRGFLLIEHLGDGPFLDRGRPVPERYEAAAELLAGLQARDWPRTLPVPGAAPHLVPAFDREAMLIEVALLADWYVPYMRGGAMSREERALYFDAWNRALDRLGGGETLVLRDYHSPNLIWRPERRGAERIGVIDFQDAVFGPPAYDVASLALDARVDIDESLERRTVDAYCRAMAAAGAFDRSAFDIDYALMAAQRNSKIIGIFVRLDRRDGKPQYLAHLPRIRRYLERALTHPALSELRDLYLGLGLVGGPASQ